jgi:23S rRNA (cytosine1962-C5)-methyltransferase
MQKTITFQSSFPDYELLDTGGLEKLERFGSYILARPEPQAVWSKAMTQEEWDRLAHARYRRTKGLDPGKVENLEKGEWIRKKQMPDQWMISYEDGNLKLKFRLGLTSFGHIGIFPEQSENWRYIYDFLKNSGKTNHRVLNLFAYTGGSTLAARAAGAEVYHVDSVKPVVSWAKENMEASGMKDIHWVVEDALKFARREARRGNRYTGIILDPPAYGRGPEGEKWVLQESINELTQICSQLLEKDGFFLMSLYSMGFSALISESLVKTHFGEVKNAEAGELFIMDKALRKLPLGTIYRFIK